MLEHIQVAAPANPHIDPRTGRPYGYYQTPGGEIVVGMPGPWEFVAGDDGKVYLQEARYA